MKFEHANHEAAEQSLSGTDSKHEQSNANPFIDYVLPVYKDIFKRADKDGSGSVSRAELNVEVNNIYQDILHKSEFARVKEQFVAIDKKLGNNDGRLDKRELTAFKKLIDENAFDEEKRVVPFTENSQIAETLGLKFDAASMQKGFSLKDLLAAKEKGAKSMAQETSELCFDLAGKNKPDDQLKPIELQLSFEKFLKGANIDPELSFPTTGLAYELQLAKWIDRKESELLKTKGGANFEKSQAPEPSREDFVATYREELGQIVKDMPGFAPYALGKTLQAAYKVGGVELVQELCTELDKGAKDWHGGVAFNQVLSEGFTGGKKELQYTIKYGDDWNVYRFKTE